MAAVVAHCGRVEDVLPALETNWADAVFCDPPYGLGLSHTNWDCDVPSQDIWAQVRRVLKPGGLMLAFGGSRMWHRLAVAIEQGGLQVLDTLMWLHSQSFAKSPSISLLIDRGKGLPPRGKEFSVIRGKPLPTRPSVERYEPRTEAARQWDGFNPSLKPSWEPVILTRKEPDGPLYRSVQKWGCGALNIDGCRPPSGRYPANVILDEGAAALLDMTYSTGGPDVPAHTKGLKHPDDEGPSRFFYCPKVGPNERNAGLDGRINTHPTLKPLALTRYLARLLLPPPRKTPRRLLVLFAGTFSEVIGAAQSGWDEIIAVEMNSEFVRIGKARLLHWCKAA